MGKTPEQVALRFSRAIGLLPTETRGNNPKVIPFECSIPDSREQDARLDLKEYEGLKEHNKRKGRDFIGNAHFHIEMYRRGKLRSTMTRAEISAERTMLRNNGYTNDGHFNHYFNKCLSLYQCTRLWGLGILCSENIWKSSPCADIYAVMSENVREQVDNIANEYRANHRDTLPTSHLDELMEKFIDDRHLAPPPNPSHELLEGPLVENEVEGREDEMVEDRPPEGDELDVDEHFRERELDEEEEMNHSLVGEEREENPEPARIAGAPNLPTPPPELPAATTTDTVRRLKRKAAGEAAKRVSKTVRQMRHYENGGNENSAPESDAEDEDGNDGDALQKKLEDLKKELSKIYPLDEPLPAGDPLRNKQRLKILDKLSGFEVKHKIQRSVTKQFLQFREDWKIQNLNRKKW
ncbi:hypothetical protein HDV00_012386 [Rhizophlyctis rosea]|nr:hypothetical protein HDV00_012386 [Rhizophlyctis rosea]